MYWPITSLPPHLLCGILLIVCQELVPVFFLEPWNTLRAPMKGTSLWYLQCHTW